MQVSGSNGQLNTVRLLYGNGRYSVGFGATDSNSLRVCFHNKVSAKRYMALLLFILVNNITGISPVHRDPLRVHHPITALPPPPRPLSRRYTRHIVAANLLAGKCYCFSTCSCGGCIFLGR